MYTLAIKLSSTEWPSKGSKTEVEIIKDQSSSSKNVLDRFIHTYSE